MHIWNRQWPFIYEHHNRVPMLLSVTFDEIATLVCNFYWAHKFVARWIRYSCVYFYWWPFPFVAVPVCGRFGLWPFQTVAVPVCGRSGLWPFRSVAVSVCGRFGLWPFRPVAVLVCGRFGLWPFRFWPFRFVAVMTRIRHMDRAGSCQFRLQDKYTKVKDDNRMIISIRPPGRVSCDSNPRETGLNHNYNLTF